VVAAAAVLTLAAGAGIAGWRWLDSPADRDSAWAARAQTQLTGLASQATQLNQASKEWASQPGPLQAQRADVAAHLTQRETEVAAAQSRLVAALSAYRQLSGLRAREAADQAKIRALNSRPGAAGPALAAASDQQRRDAVAVTAAESVIHAAETAPTTVVDPAATTRVLDLVHHAIAVPAPATVVPPGAPGQVVVPGDPAAGPEILAAPPPMTDPGVPGPEPARAPIGPVVVPGGGLPPGLPGVVGGSRGLGAAPAVPPPPAEHPRVTPPAVHVPAPPAVHIPRPPAVHVPAAPPARVPAPPAAAPDALHDDAPPPAHTPDSPERSGGNGGVQAAAPEVLAEPPANGPLSPATAASPIPQVQFDTPPQAPAQVAPHQLAAPPAADPPAAAPAVVAPPAVAPQAQSGAAGQSSGGARIVPRQPADQPAPAAVPPAAPSPRVESPPAVQPPTQLSPATADPGQGTSPQVLAAPAPSSSPDSATASSSELPDYDEVHKYSGSRWVARESQTPEGKALMRKLFGGSSAHDDSSIRPDSSSTRGGRDSDSGGGHAHGTSRSSASDSERSSTDSAASDQSDSGSSARSESSEDSGSRAGSEDSESAARSSESSSSDDHETDSGSHDSGSRDSRSEDSRSSDSGSSDSGSHDSGSRDSGSSDSHDSGSDSD
jgi:hypothetical protein